MSYALNQYNQPVVDKSDVSSSVNQVYMSPLSGGTPLRKETVPDSGISGGVGSLFYDECIQVNSLFNPGTNYYFHCKIKRLLSDQTFYVYLINYNATEDNAPTQYLKTITVKGGNEDEWVDFEIIFSPLLTFDCILFQLQRTIEDYRVGTRYSLFCYEELSRINNVIVSKISSANIGLIKMGIQSRPGLMMCLNGEEIHIGRSGVYEVRNGVITVNFLSVIAAATENPDGANPLINPDTGTVVTLDEYLTYMETLPTETGMNTNSKCIFDNSKERRIDAFTLDYMYEEE